MESEPKDEMSGQAYLDEMRENYIRFMEENSRNKVINRIDGGAKKREEEAEMNMLRRRRESTDSDEEMNISLEEVKRLMENLNSTLKSKEVFINNTNSVKIEDSKVEEEMNIATDDDENMFPRTRGRLVRYLRRQRSKPQGSSSFQIDFHHLQLPSDNE
ncbi:protein FAM133B-like [Raphanus sativus]|nr:protein FAM133B-like [Raphanus sativus]